MDTGNGKVRDKGRRQSLQRARQTSCRQRGWHGDSVDSTTPFEWSTACPSWHSVACGLNGGGDKVTLQGCVGSRCVYVGVLMCRLTQGQCVRALGGNGEGDNKVRA